MLASFFNSLLSKKTGSPGSPGAGGVQSTAKKSGTEVPWRPVTLVVEQFCKDGEADTCPADPAVS